MFIFSLCVLPLNLCMNSVCMVHCVCRTSNFTRLGLQNVQLSNILVTKQCLLKGKCLYYLKVLFGSLEGKRGEGFGGLEIYRKMDKKFTFFEKTVF